MALVINDRVKETSTTAGTGTLDLAGAVTGFVTFVAGIATGNTTYYAIFEQGTVRWEVGLGTVTDATPDTLARTTVISNSSGNTDKIVFAGTLDVFCTLPASKAVYLDASGNQATGVVGKVEGTDFTDSLLVGHSTTGTLSSATTNTGVGIDTLNAITSGRENTIIGFNAGGANTSGNYSVAIGTDAMKTTTTGGSNTAIGRRALYLATGGNNVALGFDAGSNISTSSSNICLGTRAGDNITSGDGNVVIGAADVSSATSDDQLSISDGNDGAVVWITGESTGNVEINEVWNPSLSTTGKAFVMGF